jgi:hypothetical protein
MIDDLVPVSGYSSGVSMQIHGTMVLVFVAFSAQSGAKLCKRADFKKPFQISQVKNGAIGRPDRTGTE